MVYKLTLLRDLPEMATIQGVRKGGLSALEIEDWAASLDWSDVEPHAVKVEDGKLPDYQRGWINGRKEIIGTI